MYHSRRIFQSLTCWLHRAMSTTPLGQIVAEPLERGLLRVSGDECKQYLQGLITNDVSHLDAGSSAMYAFFLSDRGRVSYDAILYRTDSPNTVYIDCDRLATYALEKHLQMYCVRRKISIEIVSDLKVWAVFEPVSGDESDSLFSNIKDRLVGDKIGSLTSLNYVTMFRDPRLTQLGIRVLCPPTEDVNNLLNLKAVPDLTSSYRYLRYRLGVGEGLVELPFGKALPLNNNIDFLHGISFHKGCYIGQETTARAYHTGTIRKRMMPLTFKEDVVADIYGMPVCDGNDEVVGKVYGHCGNLGIGLLCVSKALSAPSLQVGTVGVRTVRPSWWPLEAPKKEPQESQEEQ